MQPDANDIQYSTYGFDTNIFKVLIDSLFGGSMTFDGITALFLQIWTVYSIFAFFLSALFIIGIIYSFIRASEMGEEEEHRLHEEVHRWYQLHGGHVEHSRLKSVQEHLASANPNDWKLAIIEADVLLDRTLEKAGYIGETIGEKLKNTSSRSFMTIEDALHAHRVRNLIAHGGADFVLTQKVAKETLIMYERVFTEFGVV